MLHAPTLALVLTGIEPGLFEQDTGGAAPPRDLHKSWFAWSLPLGLLNVRLSLSSSDWPSFSVIQHASTLECRALGGILYYIAIPYFARRSPARTVEVTSIGILIQHDHQHPTCPNTQRCYRAHYHGAQAFCPHLWRPLISASHSAQRHNLLKVFCLVGATRGVYLDWKARALCEA